MENIENFNKYIKKGAEQIPEDSEKILKFLKQGKVFDNPKMAAILLEWMREEVKKNPKKKEYQKYYDDTERELEKINKNIINKTRELKNSKTSNFDKIGIRKDLAELELAKSNRKNFLNGYDTLILPQLNKFSSIKN